MSYLYKIWRKIMGDTFVEDYGAKGDGVTDDTEAIQSAVNAALKRNGVVRFKAGRYFTSGLIL